MVKGISRQVIVVHSPEPDLFEQAIFILKEDAVKEGITDAKLLEEAHRAIRSGRGERRRHVYLYGAVWAAAGALLTGTAWVLTAIL